MRQILLIMLGLSVSVYADFTRDNSTQIVTDNSTKLQWQDDAVIYKKWIEAIEYCETLTLGEYGDWRLPNINELTSLVDDTTHNPAIDSIFEYTESKKYYSSSVSVCRGGRYAWNVNFYTGYQDDGYSNGNSKDINKYVRCVRSGQ